MVTETQRLCMLLERARGACMTTAEIVQSEIEEHMHSASRQLALDGEAYYRNRSGVQDKTNKYPMRANTHIEHSFLRKLVDQKTNYLLSKPFTVMAENEGYAGALNQILGDEARAVFKSLGKEAIKKGIGWIQLYFQDGALCFKRLSTEQIIPQWQDDEHTRLDCVIRYYPQIVYEGRQKTIVTRAELWSARGVERFVCKDGGRFVPDMELGAQENHFTLDGKAYNWTAPPFLWVKYNEEELPLLWYVRELIDDYNWQTSVTADVLRDVANFIYVLKDYNGTDLEQFVRELRECMAIKVYDNGGVEKLTADLNIDAVTKFLDMHRRDLYDLARSVDTQDPNLGNASGLALKFRYADLDMDCNDLETEIRTLFARMKPFVDCYLKASGQGDFTRDDFTVILNRDIIINETEAITNVKNSVGLISEKTRVQNHPWVEDAEEEIRQMEVDARDAQSDLPYHTPPEQAAGGDPA